jgi:hypothetical protein
LTIRSELQALLQQFEDARLTAREENIQRYDNILQGYGQYEDMMDARTHELLEFLGVSHRQQQDQNRVRQQARMQQAAPDAFRRGLTAPSLQQAAERGAMHTAGMEDRILADQMQRDQIGYETALTGQALQARMPGLQFQERREDVGPRLEDVGHVAQQHGTGLGFVR